MSERLTASEREALVARMRKLAALVGDTNGEVHTFTGRAAVHLSADLSALCAEVERLTRERDAWRRLVRDDGYAMTFQSLAQYRNALLTAIDAARTTGGRDA